MKKITLTICITLLSIISFKAQEMDEEQFLKESNTAFTFNGADVLLLGTWHMGTTNDATQSSYDASKTHRREEIAALARQLAEQFKPTKILVEVVPELQAKMDSLYEVYTKNPEKISTFHGEVGLLAFQIAFHSKATLHAIDHKMGYDYGSIDQLAREKNTAAYFKYYTQLTPLLGKAKQLETQATTKQLYRYTNHPEFISFLKHVNADLLTYVNTEGNFEGADVAADFYKRNLRIFANINRLDIQPDDRVLILNGATHVAFFHEFMKYSPIYNVVDAQEYLKD